MRLADFDYALPPELIATHPAERRDASRLMLLRRNDASPEHRHFHDLPGLLLPGDCLVLNDSRVIPARVYARRVSGGMVELLLIAPIANLPGGWLAMLRPARKIKAKERLALPDGAGEIEMLPGGDERLRRVRFHLPEGESMDDFLKRSGEMPLPPYILQQRKARGEAVYAEREDPERYQTVYARPAGSVAAPTAGLHFTPELLAALENRDIEIRRVTLHVGPGTFAPIDEDNPDEHRLHFEQFVIDPENAEAIERARLDPNRRIVAVGTTAVRTLESSMAMNDRIAAGEGKTDLFIKPGFDFRAVDAMITNFHLPRSSLLMLVSAFAGRKRILAAYREAVANQYRFYSYGDAMLLEQKRSEFNL